MNELVVLQGVRELRGPGVKPHHHPGMTLDKFSWAAKQEDQKAKLAAACGCEGDGQLLQALHVRRQDRLAQAGGRQWTATTAGPLTLHLSRANALENAGIALHPLYGFAYLPGSGLKGAARAYAETVWLQTQPEPERLAASRRIVDVFGCAPRSDAGKAWLPEERRVAEDSQAGAVVFHDAWPETWPKLFVDIAAIHHAKYYQASEHSVEPPGDWETPSLISFLAVSPGTAFRFAVSPRGTAAGADPALVALAQDWLNGALATLGVGAKTAAGYGLFHGAGIGPAVLPPSGAAATFDLTLVTPAFLAGSAQEKQDCDLRGATLRGQLRWWWRTLHAAHLEPRVLRRLEAAVWGASSEGSAVAIGIESADASQPVQYPGGNDRTLRRENEIAAADRGRIPGLSYLSYGMAEKSARWYRQPGDRWTVRLVARPSEFRSTPGKKGTAIPAQMVLAQATTALWLLSRYGGLGSKARKAFGSLADLQIEGLHDIADVKHLARAFRDHCGLAATTARLGSVPALEGLHSEDVATAWSNPWYAIDAVGQGYQHAVKGMDPGLKSAKELLGMPRKGVRGRHERLASSLHLHVAASRGGLAVRIATFDLPGLNPRAAGLMASVRDKMKAWLSQAAGASRSGQTELYPPRKPRAGQRPAPPAAAHPGGERRAPAQPAAPSLRIGQQGFDAESGETIRIVAIEAARIRVLFVDDGAEEWIAIGNFRPMHRR